MFDGLSRRHRGQEWMDAPGAREDELRASLRFIERINRWLGYSRATLGHLERFSAGWRRGQRIDILDLATGSADIPRVILRTFVPRGFDVHVTAVDRHPITAALAAEHAGREHTGGRLRIVRADALALPFADRGFDYVMCNMFLHHLDEERIVRVLREMDRLARRGVVVADLLRHRRALAWIRLFTLLASPMVRHDALMSVRQALRREEALALKDRAGLDYLRYHRHFGHRFVLAGQRATG